MNNLKSYTEYAVTSSTRDFVIGFEFNYGTDAVNVTIDDVPATEAGYTVVYLNSTTIRLTPAVTRGVVRLQRETNIDAPDNRFTAGAKFIASNMDENFTQVRRSQQEVRDGFSKLSTDTYEIIDTLQEVGQAAQDAADAAEAAAQTANDAAAQVNDKISYQDLDDAVEVAFAPVTDYVALPFKAGKSYALHERVQLTNGDIVKSTVAGNTANPNTNMTGWVKTNDASQLVFNGFGSQEAFNKLYRSNFVFITDPLFGAVGDGSNESAKVQAALDYVGPYGTIYVPRGTFYVPQGLQLKIGQTIQGFGAQSSILQGNGSNVVIKTNSSISGSIRYLRLLGLGVDNFTRNSGSTGNYAVQWWAANDSHIQGCELKSRFQEALHVKYSYRGSITGNRITTSASPFAFALLNNCNGMDCSNNTVSGGQAGGGIRVGMSQTVNLSNTVIEVVGTVAVRIGGNDGADGGRCTGINLRGLYAEQARRVLECGLQFECYGVELDGFIINQVSTSVINTYEEALHLGRVNGLHFASGFAQNNNTVAFIKLYDVAAGAGWTPYLSGSVLKSKAIDSYAAMFSFNGSAQSIAPRIFGRNEIALNSDEVIGSEKEYISAPITSNVGYTNKIVVPPSLYGGLIQSVEIIEANASVGGISGTISIGSSVSATEVYTANLSTVPLVNGYAKVVTESSGKFIRPTGLVMAVSAGTHTSTFRVRIKYRA